MKNLLFLLTFFAICHPIFSQVTADSINIRQTGSKIEFIQDRRILKLKEVRSIMEPNQKASDRFSKAQLNLYTAYAFQSVGGFMIGYTFGYSLSGSNDLNYYILGSGVASILLSIPFVNAFQNHASSAVEIYNNQLHHNHSSSSLYIGFTSHGIGLTLLLE